MTAEKSAGSTKDLSKLLSTLQHLLTTLECPLLFVLATELLQYVINNACQQGHLHLPLPQPTSDFPIIQYADDILLILQADIHQLAHLEGF